MLREQLVAHTFVALKGRPTDSKLSIRSLWRSTLCYHNSFRVGVVRMRMCVCMCVCVCARTGKLEIWNVLLLLGRVSSRCARYTRKCDLHVWSVNRFRKFCRCFDLLVLYIWKLLFLKRFLLIFPHSHCIFLRLIFFFSINYLLRTFYRHVRTQPRENNDLLFVMYTYLCACQMPWDESDGRSSEVEKATWHYTWLTRRVAALRCLIYSRCCGLRTTAAFDIWNTSVENRGISSRARLRPDSSLKLITGVQKHRVWISDKIESILDRARRVLSTAVCQV